MGLIGTFTKVAQDTDQGIPAHATSLEYRTGLDLIWTQAPLQAQVASLEKQLIDIEDKTNLSDTEKMISMQIISNAWSVTFQTRTNVIKVVADGCKTCVRNIP